MFYPEPTGTFVGFLASRLEAIAGIHRIQLREVEASTSDDLESFSE